MKFSLTMHGTGFFFVKSILICQTNWTFLGATCPEVPLLRRTSFVCSMTFQMLPEFPFQDQLYVTNRQQPAFPLFLSFSSRDTNWATYTDRNTQVPAIHTQKRYTNTLIQTINHTYKHSATVSKTDTHLQAPINMLGSIVVTEQTTKSEWMTHLA